MTFKELKAGYPVYILDKNKIEASVGKVVSVSNPRFPNPVSPAANPFANNNTNTQVVDVTIENDGKQTTYTIPENLDVTYAVTDLVLATQRDSILREVENLKHSHEAELAKVEQRKADLEKCDRILTEWNPAYKEKRETEARFAALESGLGDMKSMMKSLLDKLA